MKALFNIILAVLFVSLVACKAREAAVDKKPPQAIELVNYSLDSINKEPIRLVENTVFLWKKESQMTDTQVRDIQMISKELDQLAVDQKALEIPLNEFKKLYDSEILKLSEEQKQEWNALPDNIATAQQTIDFNQGKLTIEEQKLDWETTKLEVIKNQIAELNKNLEDEKAKPDANQDSLNDLNKKIEDLNAQKTSFEKNISSIQKKQKKYQDKVTGAQAEYNKFQNQKTQSFSDVNLAYEKVKSEETRIAPERQIMSDRGNELVKKLTDNVDLMEKIEFLNIKSVADAVQVDLSWKIHPECGNCETSFSTEKGNIKNLRYQEAGGLLKFDLIDDTQEIYEFRLVRSEDEQKSGRIFYNGDLTIKNTDGTIRYGVLKFTSGKY